MGYVANVRRGIWQSFGKSYTGPDRTTSIPPILYPADLGELSRSLLDTLQKSLRLDDLALIIRDPEDEVFRIWLKRGSEETDLSGIQFALDNPLIRHFAAHPIPTHFSQLEMIPWLKVLPRRERESLTCLEEKLFVPVSTDSSLVGMLVVGQKRSRPMYRRRASIPISEYEHISNTISDAWLYRRWKATQERSVSRPDPPALADQLSQLEQTAQGTAHDLNNVFTAILAHTRLLEVKGDKGELGPHIAAIYQAALDGAKSIRSLSRTYKMQQPAKRPSDLLHHPLEVNELVRSTLQIIEPYWRQGRISFRRADRSIRAPLPDLALTLRPAGYVSGSPSELRRVLINIISNAVDALPQEHGRVEIISGQDRLWAYIRVKDNGTGVPPGIKDRIFERCFTTKGQQGSGLGLSISKTIITHHGGRLEVESKEGDGSTFTIALPLVEC